MLESNSSANDAEPQKKLTVLQSLMCGSIAGGSEVIFSHPLWVLKTRLQQQKSFSLSPRIIYRGITSNIASIVPLTAAQVGLHQFYQNVFLGNECSPTLAQKIASACFAGIGAAIIACPTEMIMTHQGKQVGHGYDVAKSLLTRGGWRCLWRGLPATALRDCPFTVSFLVAMPYVRKQLQPYCFGEADATTYAGVLTGIASTLVSQGVDTVKTVQQTHSMTEALPAITAAKRIFHTHGVQGFFKGTLPRSLSVMSGVVVIGGLTEQLERVICQSTSP